MEKKILVAIDGSPHTVNTANYLGSLFAACPKVKFDLICMVASKESDIDKAWQGPEGSIEHLPPEVRSQCRRGEECLTRAAQRLSRRGIESERITTRVVPANVGKASGIIAEAKKGIYDAVAIGRRGLGKIEEIMLGSVSAEVLDRCHGVPVWVIDGEVDSSRFLVPVDGSFHSLLAADHLGHILGDHPTAEITLFHSSAMFASGSPADPRELYDSFGRDWCEEHLSRPDSTFHGPRQVLVDHGFDRHRINWLHTFRGIEASRQIIRQALMDEFGTIVIGRRGGHINKGVFRGVSDRVLFMAEKVAVWVVG